MLTQTPEQLLIFSLSRLKHAFQMEDKFFKLFHQIFNIFKQEWEILFFFKCLGVFKLSGFQGQEVFFHWWISQHIFCNLALRAKPKTRLFLVESKIQEMMWNKLIDCFRTSIKRAINYEGKRKKCLNIKAPFPPPPLPLFV